MMLKITYYISLVFLICLCLWNTSCGYVENDGNEYVINIEGNYKILKQRNNKETELVIQDNETSFTGISPDCVAVFHDSINHIIYYEELLTPKTSTYYEIKINTVDNQNLNVPKKSIEKKSFQEKTQKITRYWKFPQSATS